MSYTYEHPRPAVTVDAVVFARGDGHWDVLLIRRARDPFAGKWALPGGFVDPDEPLDRAARRELEEETGITSVKLEQLRAFGDPGRDPRGHTISIVHWGVIEGRPPAAEGADDASEAAWWRIDALPELAFDHERVLSVAIDALRRRPIAERD